MEAIERKGEAIMKQQKQAKEFYRLAGEFVQGIESDNAQTNPTLEEFRNKAREKLCNLNPGDPEVMRETVEKLHKVDEDKRVSASFPSMKAWKRQVLLSPGLCFCFVASRLLLRAESLFSKTLEIESWMVTSNENRRYPTQTQRM